MGICFRARIKVEIGIRVFVVVMTWGLLLGGEQISQDGGQAMAALG